jgi:hypothetical protein
MMLLGGVVAFCKKRIELDAAELCFEFGKVFWLTQIFCDVVLFVN